jgi:hypothetical protein
MHSHKDLVLPEWATFNLPSPAGRRVLNDYYAECRREKRVAAVYLRRHFRLPPRPDLPAWTDAERTVTLMSRRDLHRIRRRLADARHMPWVTRNCAMLRSAINAHSLVLEEIARRRDIGNAVYRIAQAQSARRSKDIRLMYPRLWESARIGYPAAPDPAIYSLNLGNVADRMLARSL